MPVIIVSRLLNLKVILNLKMHFATNFDCENYKKSRHQLKIFTSSRYSFIPPQKKPLFGKEGAGSEFLCPVNLQVTWAANAKLELLTIFYCQISIRN